MYLFSKERRNNKVNTALEQLVRITDFAKIKRVSRQTVYSLIKKNKINTKNIGSVRFIILNETAKKWQPEQGKRSDLNKKQNRRKK